MILGIVLLVIFEILFSMGLYVIGLNSITFIVFLVISWIAWTWTWTLTAINDRQHGIKTEIH